MRVYECTRLCLHANYTLRYFIMSVEEIPAGLLREDGE